jgi:hypothetical protein
MPTLLSQITTPYVEYLWLAFDMDNADQLDNVNWSSIEHHLTRPQWANLHQLKISLYVGMDAMGRSMECVKLRLPILESRGVVHVSDYLDPWE